MIRQLLPLLAGLCLLATPAPAGAEDKPAKKPVYKNVGVDEFEKLTKQPGVVILDVRTPTEFRKGHLKDAVLIDFQQPKEFEEKVKALDKSKTYLIHCQVGGRSAKACAKFDTLGFATVYNLEGGFKAWEKAGKPVEK